MVNLNNVTNLVGVLTLLCDDDANTVQKAEKTLKPFLKTSASAVPLMQVLVGGSDDAVREKAATLLKKRIGAFYPSYTREQQNQLKAQLLSQLLSEQSKAVANAVCGVVGSVAGAIYSNHQQWHELFEFIFQLIAQDPDEKHRVLAFSLLAVLFLSIPEEGFLRDIYVFGRMFNAGLKDVAAIVRKASLNTLLVAISTLGEAPEIMSFSDLFVPIFNILHTAMKEEDEDILVSGFLLFRTCCELEQPLINDHLEPAANFTLVVLLQTDIEGVKDAAGAAFLDIVRFRPKVFAKKKLVGPVISMFMDRIEKEESSVNAHYFKVKVTDTNENEREEEDQDNNDGDDDDEANKVSEVQKLTQNTIDLMSTYIPSKHFLPAVSSLIMNTINSSDPLKRKASCVVLGNVVEGCSEQLRQQLDTLLGKLYPLLEDESIFVRDAAVFALGRFIRHCQPEIFMHSDQIFPILLKGLEDPHLVILGGILFDLELYCESVPPQHLIPYLEPLIERFDVLFSKGFKNLRIKEVAIGALSELLGNVKDAFEPYVERTMSLMIPLLSTSNSEEYGIRGSALNCIGTIILAFGDEKISESHYEAAVKSAMENFELDNAQLKGHSFIFVANALKTVGKKFVPHIPQLIQYITATIKEDEFLRVDGHNGAEPEAESEDNIDEEGNWEEEEDDERKTRFRSDLVDQKIAAITALGSISEETRSFFLPYLYPCFNLLADREHGALYSNHADIRAEAIKSLSLFVDAVIEGIETPSEQGGKLHLPPDVSHLTEAIFRECFSLISQDEFEEPVSNAFEAIDLILQTLGIAALEIPVAGTANQVTIKDVILSHISIYLSEQAPCQLRAAADNAEGEEEEEEDGDDHTDLMDSVASVIGSLARLLGKDFVASFDQLHSKLMKFTKPSRPYLDRNMALSCYVDVFEQIGPLSMKYAEPLLPVIKLSLTHSAPYLRHNAAYCVGLLIENSGDVLVPHYIDILQWLYPVCVRGKNEVEESIGSSDVDNALSAVAKMILVAPEKVPIPQVLPVLFSALPLNDSHESLPVFKAIFKLLEMNDTTILSMISEVVKALGDNFHPESEVPEETKTIAAEALKLLRGNEQHTGVVNSYIASISDEEQREALEKSLQRLEM
mmetsp:Transcript_21294/g.23133  ORF Transcript_21294/g.23133 Transcript_21294/m.23133 type:complete len:1129 (+) Transcript_21294:26-3412(+)